MVAVASREGVIPMEVQGSRIRRGNQRATWLINMVVSSALCTSCKAARLGSPPHFRVRNNGIRSWNRPDTMRKAYILQCKVPTSRIHKDYNDASSCHKSPLFPHYGFISMNPTSLQYRTLGVLPRYVAFLPLGWLVD
jgi:hypothetical protein